MSTRECERESAVGLNLYSEAVHGTVESMLPTLPEVQIYVRGRDAYT